MKHVKGRLPVNTNHFYKDLADSSVK